MKNIVGVMSAMLMFTGAVGTKRADKQYTYYYIINIHVIQPKYRCICKGGYKLILHHHILTSFWSLDKYFSEVAISGKIH